MRLPFSLTNAKNLLRKIEVYIQALLVSVTLESKTLKCFHLTVISNALSSDWVNVNSNFY